MHFPVMETYNLAINNTLRTLANVTEKRNAAKYEPEEGERHPRLPTVTLNR